MTLSNISSFVEAASCENFTEAARNLYVSQPNLSKQIAQIEKEVGVPLFERRKRGVVLTAAGHFLYEQLKDIPALINQAFEQALAIGRSGIGRLLMGILEGQVISSDILSRLQAFGSKYPQLDVDLERNSFSNLRTGLMNGHYDMIITMSFEEKMLPGALMSTILPQRGAFAINRRNPKCEQPELQLADLRDENFLTISVEESPMGYELMVRQCEQAGFTPRIVRTFNSLESLLLGVETGLGIAMLDRNTRLENNREVRIVPVADSEFSHVSAFRLPNHTNTMVEKLAEALMYKSRQTHE